MWMLALGGAFLAAAQACVFCRLPAHDLSSRLAWLCRQMEVQWKDCETSWNFTNFALGKSRHPGLGPATVTPMPQTGQHVASQLCPSTVTSVHSPLWTHWSLPLGELLWTLGKTRKTPESSSGLMRKSLSLPISIDEVSMNKVAEKTHRVLRVMGEAIGEGTT